jgi:hypothetical protein
MTYRLFNRANDEKKIDEEIKKLGNKQDIQRVEAMLSGKHDVHMSQSRQRLITMGRF